MYTTKRNYLGAYGYFEDPKAELYPKPLNPKPCAEKLTLFAGLPKHFGCRTPRFNKRSGLVHSVGFRVIALGIENFGFGDWVSGLEFIV